MSAQREAMDNPPQCPINVVAMEWAVMKADRSGPEGVLLILGDRKAAETIAAEVRHKGHRVKVLPYATQGSATGAEGLIGGRVAHRQPVIF